MGKLVLLILGVISFNAAADWKATEEDYKIATQISNIVGKKCKASPTRRVPIKVVTAYLRGSPFDGFNAPEAGWRWEWMMGEIAKARGYDLTISTAHHTSWRGLCEQGKENPDAVKVFIGHSYGTSGIVKAANCLEDAKLKVDGLLTISSYDFLAGVNVREINANVTENLNFFTNDSGIPGYSDHYAADPKMTYIRNIQADVTDGSWSHLNVAIKLVPLLALQTAFYIEHRGEHLKIPDHFDTEGLDGRLDEFKPCD